MKPYESRALWLFASMFLITGGATLLWGWEASIFAFGCAALYYDKGGP